MLSTTCRRFFSSRRRTCFIPSPALQDRMEVIPAVRLYGTRKSWNSQAFSGKKQTTAAGLNEDQIQFNDDGLSRHDSSTIRANRASAISNGKSQRVAQGRPQKSWGTGDKQKVIVNADKDRPNCSDPRSSGTLRLTGTTKSALQRASPGLKSGPDSDHRVHPDGRQG